MTEKAHDGGRAEARSWPERVFAAMAALCLFAMMALTFASVVARYFLDRPFAGDDEIQSFLLGLIIFTALPIVTRAQHHIAVRSFAALLKGRALFLQRAFVLAVTGIGFAFIGYLILGQAATLAEEGILTSYLDIPEAPFAYLFAILTWAAALAAFERLARLWRSGAAEPASGGRGAGPE